MEQTLSLTCQDPRAPEAAINSLLTELTDSIFWCRAGEGFASIRWHSQEMEACVHPKSQQKTQGLLFYLREKSEDFSLFFFWFKGRGNSISERGVVLFFKKINNQYLWPPNRKLSLCWGSIRENQAISGTEQGRYCAELDNTLDFSTPALGNWIHPVKGGKLLAK